MSLELSLEYELESCFLVGISSDVALLLMLIWSNYHSYSWVMCMLVQKYSYNAFFCYPSFQKRIQLLAPNGVICGYSLTPFLSFCLIMYFSEHCVVRNKMPVLSNSSLAPRRCKASMYLFQAFFNCVRHGRVFWGLVGCFHVCALRNYTRTIACK